MDALFHIDWAEIFVPQMSVLEILVRGTIAYFAVLALLRILPKWQAGSGSMASMMFIVMLGGLAGYAVRGGAETLTDIFMMIATVTLWVVVVDWLSFRYKWFHSLVQADPSYLVRDGRVLRRNLRHQSMTVDDLKAALRREGVEDMAMVRDVFLEPDGRVSVVKRKAAEQAAGATRPARARKDRED